MEISQTGGSGELIVGVTDILNGTNGLFLYDNHGVLGEMAVTSGVTSVSNSDGTLTISPTTGAVVASLNLAHANTWTANQTIFGATFSLNDSILQFQYEPFPTVPTLALVATSTGNVTLGIHSVKVTFITAQGETAGSNASGSVFADSTHKQLSVTNIPTGSAMVTGRNIYMTKAGGSIYYKLGSGTTIANNIATTFTINVADASLSATVAPIYNTTSGQIWLDGTQRGQLPGFSAD